MQKKIKRFQRLATVRKKDISKEINNSNLVQNEIVKNESLIDQINSIMENSKNNSSNKIIALGGINENNFNNLSSTNCIGFASISWAKKNGLRKLRPFKIFRLLNN